MEEYKRRIQEIVLMFLLLAMLFGSCTLTKEKKTIEVKQVEKLEKVSPKVRRDTTTLPDICGLYRIPNRNQLTGKGANAFVLSCIVEKTFYGHETGEKWIARFIDNSGCHHSLGYIKRSPRLRGPIIFEAFLRQKQGTKRLFTTDDEPSDCSEACYCSSPMIGMIKTIDGKSAWRYITPKLPIVIHKYNRDYYAYTDEQMVERDKAIKNAIQTAWDEGLIILYDYGEEIRY